jgi:hypothetical protein
MWWHCIVVMHFRLQSLAEGRCMPRDKYEKSPEPKVILFLVPTQLTWTSWLHSSSHPDKHSSWCSLVHHRIRWQQALKPALDCKHAAAQLQYAAHAAGRTAVGTQKLAHKPHTQVCVWGATPCCNCKSTRRGVAGGKCGVHPAAATSGHWAAPTPKQRTRTRALRRLPCA